MVIEAHRFPGWLQAWRGGEGKRLPIPFESIFWNPNRTQAASWENDYAIQLGLARGL
jgi:hypothetical protein